MRTLGNGAAADTDVKLSHLNARAKALDGRALIGARSTFTVRDWGQRWLARREKEGLRSARALATYWRTHFESSAWIDWPIDRVTAKDANAWWTDLHQKGNGNPTYKARSRRSLLAGGTLRNIVQFARSLFEDARREGWIDRNPFLDLKVSRSRNTTTRDEITVLSPEEQTRALALYTGWYRVVVQVALSTGLRRGELVSLRLEDLFLRSSSPNLWVRHGAVTLERPVKGVRYDEIDGAFFLPTKGGRPRRVFLNAMGIEAFEAWESMLRTYAESNPYSLLFPREDGSPRGHGVMFRGFTRIARMIGRSFTWHGLRHTCATSLLAGWWGRSWNVKEVQRHLGHSSLITTQRYLHVLEEDLARQASCTDGPERRPEMPYRVVSPGSISDTGDAKSPASAEALEPKEDPSNFATAHLRRRTVRELDFHPVGTSLQSAKRNADSSLDAPSYQGPTHGTLKAHTAPESESTDGATSHELSIATSVGAFCGHGNGVRCSPDDYAELLDRAAVDALVFRFVEAEREACARIAETEGRAWIADQIRARGSR
jgi:integrase